MTDRPIPELEEELAAASASKDPIRHIDALNALGWVLRISDVPRARTLGTKARELAIEHGYTLGQARAARVIGMTFHDTEGLRSIFDFANEAMRLFDEADDPVGRAASRDFLAGLYEFIGDLPGAMELALSALRIAREINDPKRQAYALVNVGGVLSASGEFEAGVEKLEEALRLFESVDETDGMGSVYTRLCRVFKQAGRLEEALAIAQRCRSEGEASGNEYMLHSALAVMAEIEAERGNPTHAEELYRTAIDVWREEVGRDLIGAEAQVALSRLMLQRGALEEAEAQLKDAIAGIARASVLTGTDVAAQEAMADLRERQGRYTEAITHLRAAKELREQSHQRDVRTKLDQVEVRAAIEAAKRDAEVHKLRYAELHAMQSKLVETGKMALVGKLAAGMAHEINTPLGVLRSNADVLAKATERMAALLSATAVERSQVDKLTRTVQACAKTSAEAMDRIDTIAHAFRRFSQLDQAEQRTYDVREGLDSALTLLAPSVSSKVRIERSFGRVPKLTAWPRELNHAFLTVLQNAVQSIDGEGLVQVETSVEPDQANTPVIVRVRDTGRGMSQTQVDNLFEVGWSADGPRTKMRFGLSAAYATMQKHGGTIQVQSEQGRGTAVTFRFPQPQAAPP